MRHVFLILLFVGFNAFAMDIPCPGHDGLPTCGTMSDDQVKKISSNLIGQQNHICEVVQSKESVVMFADYLETLSIYLGVTKESVVQNEMTEIYCTGEPLILFALKKDINDFRILVQNGYPINEPLKSHAKEYSKRYLLLDLIEQEKQSMQANGDIGSWRSAMRLLMRNGGKRCSDLSVDERNSLDLICTRP